MANYKRFVLPENQLILQKNCEKKKHRDTFENDTILANYKRFVLPKNQLILQKTVKKKNIGIVF